MRARVRVSFSSACFWSRGPPRVRRTAYGVPATESCQRSYANLSSAQPLVSTPIQRIISDSIRASGPIPVSTYIQLCLSHPTEGYYMKQRPDDADVFGVKGDFITSPEISQVFGELIGVWLLSQWQDSHTGKITRPKIRLVELGPGRGTLMDDILRTFSAFTFARDALAGIHLIETSPVMRSRQHQKLAARHKIPLQWYDSLDDIPQATKDEFTMIVAHEFFDALPVNILEKTADGFREVLIDLPPPQPGESVATPNASNPSPFRFVLCPTTTPRSNLLSVMSPRYKNLPVGSRIEVSSAGWRIARKIGEMVSGSKNDSAGENSMMMQDPGGAALIIDYGDEHVFGASLRAFRAHRLVDVLEKPGMSDLTTNVDFALLKEAIEGLAMSHGPLQQSKFLLRMGLAQRLAALIKQASSAERRLEIERAGRRLIDESGQGMGTAYRALGIVGPKGEQEAQVWPFVSQINEQKRGHSGSG